MKAVLMLVLCCSSLSFMVDAQTWMSLEQAPLNLRYEIPYNWYVGGYMSSRSCNCTSGTINTAPNRKVNMVIFYSDEYDVDSLMEQDVWGYKFITPPILDTIRTPHLDFEMATSRWENDSEVMVIRLTTEVEGQAYVIYFWGPDETLGTMENTIRHIVMSISLLS